MIDSLLKTGQVSGLIGLSSRTIQRYISQYPNGFSEQARQHSQGRRYTDRDVKALAIIHSMKKQRARHEQIEAVLSSGYENQIAEIFNVQGMLKIIADAEREAGKIKKQSDQIRQWVKWIRYDFYSLKKSIREINERLDKQDARILELKAMAENALKAAQGKPVKKDIRPQWMKSVWDD